MPYTPRYVNLSDVPVQIPDDYSGKEKEDALEVAESTLELDLNEGEQIPDSDVIVPMLTAVKHLATCHLAKGSEHPDDVSLGDLSDTGDTKVSYAQSFCDEYENLVDKIIQSGILEDDEEGESTAPYTYSTDDPTPGNRWTDKDHTTEEETFTYHN